MDLNFQLVEEPDIKGYGSIIAALLKEQGKVGGDLSKKHARCKLLCLVSIDDRPVGMGAIKEPTLSDFKAEKADLPALADDFSAELGYIYVPNEHGGNGYASAAVVAT